MLLPMMMAELAMTSWSTIAHRTLLMAQGKCSPAEYRRMVSEKAAAARESLAIFGNAKGPSGIAPALRPWLKRTRANAKRLSS
jgi:hypothetical protein